MKTILLLVLLLPLSAFPQGFVGTTNEILVDAKGTVFSPLPTIRWMRPDMESSFSNERSLVIEADITSSVPLSELKLIIYHGDEERAKSFPWTPDQTTQKIQLTITLMEGETRAVISGVTSKGAKIRSQRTVVYGKDEVLTLVSANRKDYALIFATDKYENFGELVNPVDDSRAIKKLLEEKYGFTAEVVENSSFEEISTKIYEYNARKFNSQDQLFIFFAGHGLFDEVLGEGYVVATNSIANDKGKSSYISHTTLRNNIDNIKCDHIFLAMDVCFGGTFDPKLARDRAPDVYAEISDAEMMARKLSKRTRKYLTSGSKTYVSDGIPGKHSPFAAKFIEALRSVGDGKDRLLTLTELQSYFIKLATEPRTGSFGMDEAGSDFVFVSR